MRWARRMKTSLRALLALAIASPLFAGCLFTPPEEEASSGYLATTGSGYGGTTATFWADIASAVQDSGNPNQVASTYLTSGVPNAGYYTQIANTIASAISLAENGPVSTPMARPLRTRMPVTSQCCRMSTPRLSAARA